MKTQRNYPVYREAIAAFALLTLGVSGGIAWWTWQTTKPTSVNQQTSSTQVNNLPNYSLPETTLPPLVVPQKVEAITPKSTPEVLQLEPKTYWLKVDHNHIHLVPQPVTLTAGLTLEEALKVAFTNLLNNPKTADLNTTIPSGTKLLSLRVTQAGIYVNLSPEFSQGGGSTSMAYRVAQVIYTATSIDPKAKVFISVAGEPIDTDHPLGGEGLILRQPITRPQFVEDFSIS
ncbi:GerMN domain-containing protein [Fortiea sp. LEGE XX443]|uniref:GerMN domain-containing protein n=1 Tax=Fortiea sp. LEGE XX443 TaxID=1828611 RepID=UPI00187DE4DD|nr:GerMN domain-containing protein [Fortiea sp. LEGE XX443]MBE9008331.1 GerMN domain-containing protein [Fortiea sp. LEGE XX443]